MINNFVTVYVSDSIKEFIYFFFNVGVPDPQLTYHVLLSVGPTGDSFLGIFFMGFFPFI